MLMWRERGAAGRCRPRAKLVVERVTAAVNMEAGRFPQTSSCSEELVVLTELNHQQTFAGVTRRMFNGCKVIIFA